MIPRLPTALALSTTAVLLCSWGCNGGRNSGAPTSSATNVLMAVVSFDAPEPGSVQVLSSGPGEQLATPWYPVPAGPGTVTVVGLRASTTYVHTVAFVSSVSGQQRTLVTVSSMTGDLPPDVAAFQMTITPVTSSPGPGYLLVSGAGNFQLAFDGAGTLRWYQRFDPMTQECKMQYDGTFTAFVGTSVGFQPVQGDYVRFRADGAIIASYTTLPDPTEPGSPTVYTDNHELLITRDAQGKEKLHLFGYELRPTGASGALGAWHEILRQAPDGTVEFRWKTWDYFSASDTTETVSGGMDVDHANSLEIAPDGNYVASFRDLDEVTKIDSTTGAILWRLGGKHNQFKFVADPLGGFSGQHSVRVLANGNVLIYDDGLQHQPKESRGVEYVLDTTAMTATLVWQFRHSPAVFTPYVGSVERLANGNTLVAFAAVGLVCEVDPTGSVAWEARAVHPASTGTPLFSYRIRRLPSLYQFQVP